MTDTSESEGTRDPFIAGPFDVLSRPILEQSAADRRAREDLRAVLGDTPAGEGWARILARLVFLASGAEDLDCGAELAELAITEAANDPRASRWPPSST